MRAVEASLRRLGTDHIDLYQVHEWDGITPLEETLERARRHGAQRQGPLHRRLELLGLAPDEGARRLDPATHYERFVSQQIYYSLHNRHPEDELVPVTLDQGLGILVWSPLAGGLLSGKYRRDGSAPAGSRHLTEWSEPPVHDQSKLYDIIETAVEIGEAHGVSAARVSLAWTLSKPGVTSLIVGARTTEQLRDSLAAADLVLSDDEIARLDAVSAEPLRYPLWHQAQTSGDRLGPADLPRLRPYLG